MNREEVFEAAAKGDDFTCPMTVCLTREGKVVRVGDPEGYCVLRYAGETMDGKTAKKLGIDTLYDEPAEPVEAEAQTPAE